MKIPSSLAVLGAALVVAMPTLPVSARTNVNVSSMILVADLGRDQDALSTHKDQPAAIVSLSVQTPAREALREHFGRTVVLLHLGAQGQAVGASVAKSSGYTYLDAAAVEAVKEGTYRPERIDGVPVAGSYLVDVAFPSETN